MPLNSILCLSFIALAKLLNFSSGHYISPVRLVQFASIVLQARVAAQICIFDMPHPLAALNHPKVIVVGKSRVCFDLIYANGCIDIALCPLPSPLHELSTHLHGPTINLQYNGSLADFNMFLACF